MFVCPHIGHNWINPFSLVQKIDHSCHWIFWCNLKHVTYLYFLRRSLQIHWIYFISLKLVFPFLFKWLYSLINCQSFLHWTLNPFPLFVPLLLPYPLLPPFFLLFHFMFQPSQLLLELFVFEFQPPLLELLAVPIAVGVSAFIVLKQFSPYFYDSRQELGGYFAQCMLWSIYLYHLFNTLKYLQSNLNSCYNKLSPLLLSVLLHIQITIRIFMLVKSYF